MRLARSLFRPHDCWGGDEGNSLARLPERWPECGDAVMTTSLLPFVSGVAPCFHPPPPPLSTSSTPPPSASSASSPPLPPRDEKPLASHAVLSRPVLCVPAQLPGRSGYGKERFRRGGCLVSCFFLSFSLSLFLHVASRDRNRYVRCCRGFLSFVLSFWAPVGLFGRGGRGGDGGGDSRTDRRTDGRTDGQTDRRTDGRTDGRVRA